MSGEELVFNASLVTHQLKSGGYGLAWNAPRLLLRTALPRFQRLPNPG